MSDSIPAIQRSPYRDADVAPGYWDRNFGVGSEIDEQEWQLFLRRREQLMDSINQRLRLGQQIGVQLQDSIRQNQGLSGASNSALMGAIRGAVDPDTAAVAQMMADTFVNQRARAGAFDQREPARMTHELLGAADFYGIDNPGQYSPDQLVAMLQERRDWMAESRSRPWEQGGDATGFMNASVDVLQRGIGALFIGSTDSVIEVSQRIPFIGDALAKTKTIQDADRWLAMVEEGFRGDQVGAEVTGWNVAKGLGGVVGYLIPAEAAWKVAGALGSVPAAATIGARLSPIARAAVRGGTAAWMLEGGGEESIQHRILMIGMGAGFAGTAQWAIPKVLARLQRWFPTRFGNGMPLDNELPSDWDPGWEDAELVDELFLPGSTRPPSGGRGPMPGSDGGSGGFYPPRQFPPSAPLDAVEGSTMGWTPGVIDVPSNYPVVPWRNPGTFAEGPAALPGATAVDDGTQAVINATMEVRIAEMRAAGLDPRSGLGDLDAMQRALVIAERDPNTLVMAIDRARPSTALAVQQAAQELGVPVNAFQARADEIVVTVPAEAAQALQTRIQEIEVSAGPSNDLQTRIRERFEGSRSGWRQVTDLNPVQPNPLGAPKSEPLPLPRLRGGVEPTQVQDAWNTVSARYPRLAGTIQSFAPLPERYATATAGYFPGQNAIGVSANQPLSAETLFHELTHVAQHQRRQILSNQQMGPEQVNRMEAYAHRVGRAARGIPAPRIAVGQTLAEAEAQTLVERTAPMEFNSADGDALSIYLERYGSTEAVPGREPMLRPDDPSPWPMPTAEEAGGIAIPDLFTMEQRLRMFPDDAGARAMYARELDRGLYLTEAIGADGPQIELAKRVVSQLQGAEAIAEANNLTKHATVIESPALAQLSKNSAYDDADVVTAAVQTNPGQISVVRNVSDLGKTVRNLVRETTPGGIGPQDFRVVERPDGVHLLVSDGLTITNKRANQYRDWGIFEGQQARTLSGQDVVIVEPGEMTLVRTPYGQEPFLVKHSELIGGRASAEFVEPAALAGLDAPQSYVEFRKFVLQYMADQSGVAGLPEFGWLETETASQIPALMDRFLSEQGITQPGLRRTMEAYFNQRRVQDYKNLAADEFAEADRVARQVGNEVAAAQASGELETSIYELAATKGFQLVPYSNNMGFTLRDQIGELEIPVANEQAAELFLRNFDRELPDVTPMSDVPMEAVPTIPGAPAQTMLEPVLRGGAQMLERVQEKTLRWLTRELERVVAGGGGAGGGGGEPPWGTAANPDAGWPDPALPPGHYAMPGQTYQPSLAEQFRNADRRLYELMEDQDSILVNWLFPMRSWALHWESRLTEIGIDQGRMWQQYNDIVTGRSKAHNAATPLYQRWQTISSQFRRRFKRHGDVARIQELPTWNDQLREMQRLGYSEREIAAQRQVSVFMDELFGQSGLDNSRRIWNYISHVRARQALGVEDPWYDARGSLTPEVNWFAEMAREGNMQFRELDVDVLVPLYIRGMTFREHVAPAWEVMAQAWQAQVPTGVPTDIPTHLRDQVKGWLHLVRFGFSGESEVAVQGIRKMLNNVGVPVTNQDIQGFWNTIQANMYRAGIGLRPHIWFRDSINPLLTGVKIGLKPVGEVYMNFLRNPAFRQAAAERGLRGGWLETGAVQLPGGDMFSQQPLNQQGEQVFGPVQGQIREGLARIGDLVHDLTPRHFRGGVQGTYADPLYWYTKLGEFNRVVSGEAGYQVAVRAIQKYRNNELSLPELVRESKAAVWRAPVRRQFQELIATGQDEQAAFLLANEAANMQNRYGTVEHSPKIQRSGVIGRQAMMYGTFSMQHMQQLADGVGRSDIPLTERAAFMARYGLITAALAGASVYTGWNFYKWMWPGSLTFMGGPLVEPTIRAYQIATGAVNELTGQYVTPEQRAAEAASQHPNNPGVIGTLFPYMGGVQTMEGMSNMLQSNIPFEGTLRYLLTGQQTAEPNVRNWMSDLSFYPPGTAPGTAQSGMMPGPTIEAAQQMQSGTGLNWQQLQSMGVSDSSRVYTSKKGYPVYDTNRRTRDGKVPTHRLDLPSGRREGETWEQYEDRVIATPTEAFGPEAHRVETSIEALHPEMQGRLQAFLQEADRQGVQLRINETYRPQVRQEFLFQAGRAPGRRRYPVTWTLTSNHADRRAVDLRARGERGYLWIQANAPRFGLGVLGMDDPGHVELPQAQQPGVQPSMQQSQGTGMMQ